MRYYIDSTYRHKAHLQGNSKGIARDILPLLRYVAVMLLMVVGASDVKAQDTDYSGTYYIASNGNAYTLDKKDLSYTYNVSNPDNNFYLVPTSGPDPTSPGDKSDAYFDYTANNPEKSFLTTYQTGRPDNDAVWELTKVTDNDGTFYYVKHAQTGKYVIYEPIFSGGDSRRKCMHLDNLDENTSPARWEKCKFVIGEMNSSYYFVPKEMRNSNGNSVHMYWNLADRNRPSRHGLDASKYYGGLVGLYKLTNANLDVNSKFILEDIILPVIEQQDNNTITITCSGCSIYYTTDGSTTPDPSNNNQLYSGPISMTEPITTVKAIAVKAKAGDENYDTYSRCVTLTTQRYIGSSHSYMIQSVECTDFYMMPGDVSSNNITVNTSSLFRSTMAWKFFNAGNEGGVQYYYIKNGDNYLLCTNNNLYIKSNTVFDNETDKTGYKFFIEQVYDADSNPDGFVIVPKGITDPTYCIHKSGYVAGPPEVLANAKTDVVKGQSKARSVKRGRWNIIPYSAPGNVLPSTLLTSNDENPILLKIENVGTAGQYMSPPATGNVGTATLGNDALAWYIKEASSDSERKYYYIIHKKTGYYLKFNKATTVNNNQNNVLDFCAYNNVEAPDRYQFVFAKSTIDGAYYIVPKGLENVSQNNYYALYLDGTNPIKSNNHRQSNNSKWKLVPFCYNPVFEESNEGDITLTHITEAEIHYTIDGTEPDENSTTYSDNSWDSSEQLRIKAIAVIKEDDVIVSTSEIVTLLNKPDVTLESGPFTYKGTEHTPAVNSVSVSTTSAPKYPDPETYNITYSNNTNAGNASVIIEDLDPDDRWYIWNVPTTNFTIDKKMLTVTADNKRVEYGSPAPKYTVTITGFVNGEGSNVLTTIPTATSDEYTTASAVGSILYITPSGGVDENYDFTYVDGTLTVAAAFVTLTANSGTVTYNGTEQEVTGFTCSVDGLTFTGVSASGSGTNAGTYDVVFTGVTLQSTTDATGQYVVTDIVDGTLTINPAAVTVTADSKTKTYGEEDPELTATVSGMVNNESTSLLTYSLNRATGNNAGTYAITPTGEATQGNYTVSYENATFTINQKDLTITANNHSIIYGNAPDNNGVTYSGFIEGEDQNTTGVFNGSLVYNYNSENDGSGDSYITTIPTGPFYIIPSGLTSTNYSITYVTGTLTVTAKSIGAGSIASGFALEFGDDGAIILNDGETQLILTTDYTIGNETTTPSGKYSQRRVSGTGNYTGYFDIRNANVNFQTDDNGIEWSATFIAEQSGPTDIGHALPDGIKAYIITGIDDSWAIPEELEYIPEGVPVLLVSNKESGGFLVEDANSSSITEITESQKTANMLEEVKEGMAGYVDDDESPNYQKSHFNVKTIYLLNYNEFVYNMDGYLSKGKVYLNPNHPTDPDPSSTTAPSSPAPMRLRINWDKVNGIKEIPDNRNAEKWNSGQWYGIDGRPLNGTPTRKGLYFHYGKKVIIKEDL